jgi:secreted Zn-dependent insulinase-like peptidase
MKDGVVSSLKEKRKSLLEEGEFLWSHIQSGDLAFEEKEVAAE